LYRRAIRTFKVERIQSIYELDETYLIPADFNANDFLSGAWDITVGGPEVTVRLKSRTPEATRLMAETMWHPSMTLENHTDGSVIMTLKVADTPDFTSWVMWWGENAEVLEPPELRRRIAVKAAQLAVIYHGSNDTI
jgi:predicted DNA-binding transcriptional regulator YafY